MTDEYFNNLKEIVNRFYNEARILEAQARDSEERVYGRRIIHRTYADIAAIARSFKIATPPFRERESTDGRGMPVTTTTTEPPVYSPPAGPVTFEPVPGDGKAEVIEYQKKRRAKDPADGSV